MLTSLTYKLGFCLNVFLSQNIKNCGFEHSIPAGPTQRGFNVRTTSSQRYGRCMGFKTTLCASWVEIC